MSNAVTTINHIGVSGGKDSTALLLWAVHESGYPLESIRVSFCDTGNETEATYDYIRYLSETVHPIEWITPPLDFYELVEKKRTFPTRKRQFCTELLKIEPMTRHILSLIDQGYDVVLHSGVRAGESPRRAEYTERSWDTRTDCEMRYPLLAWTLSDVWDCLNRYGVKRNPLYDLGCKRVGCLPCINSAQPELVIIAQNMPERFDRIREMENRIQSPSGGLVSFFHRSKVPYSYRHRVTDTKSGERMAVCGIDDAVQRAIDNAWRTVDIWEDEDAPYACSNRYGLCE